MNRSKWSHAIIKFLCKGNAFWTRFSVQSASLGTRRLLPGNLGGLSPELRIRENILFTEFLPSVLKKKIPVWEAIQCHLAIFKKGAPSFP